ncbi:MAG TPA: hypothetical protein VH374_11695 [Polyangia bacterium]|jgi:hypothetical protein|nr:hypothetical protein [Polyangia bacterium]
MAGDARAIPGCTVKPRLIIALLSFAACGTFHRPPPPPEPLPEPPFHPLSYQARVAADLEPGAPQRWTDVIVDGAGHEQRRACTLAVASELRSITALPGVTGSIVRACAAEALPTLTAPIAPGVVLVEARAAGDELRAQAALAQAEPLSESLRARVATFTRYSSPEACAEMLLRSQAKRQEVAWRSRDEQTEQAQRKLKAAEAERDTSCTNQRAIATQCDALPPATDLARPCKGGQGARRCRAAHQQARTRQRCEASLQAAEHDCERTNRLVEDGRKRLPSGPVVLTGDPPVCQPG